MAAKHAWFLFGVKPYVERRGVADDLTGCTGTSARARLSVNARTAVVLCVSNAPHVSIRMALLNGNAVAGDSTSAMAVWIIVASGTGLNAYLKSLKWR